QGKTITRISEQVVKRLSDYDWPGNVRELGNIIERAVIASPGPDLLFPETLLPHEKQPAKGGTNKSNAKKAIRKLQSLSGVQREHILHVLRTTQGQLEGKGGAAEILALKPSTLRNRMRKLGISRKQIETGDQ
ncbi:AAA family ATPase, partial [Planctomycetota bacterium]